MADNTARLEETVEQLKQTVLQLEHRLEALENGRVSRAARPREAAPEGTGPAAAVVEKNPYDPIAILSLIGRLLLILAGGYFLRALTEMGTLPVPVGLALAFIYALVWLYLSDRAAGRGQVPSGVFHALASAMVAYPLVIEATIRFKVLSGVVPVLLVALLTAALLYLAWRHRLRVVAWIPVAAGLPAGVALLVQAGVVVPVACYLIAFGLAVLWFSYARGWNWLRWPVALAADIAVVGVTLRALGPEHHELPAVAMLLQSLLLAGYLASVAVQTLVRQRNVSIFEMLQTAAALAVGFGGAVYLTRDTGGALQVVLGLSSILVGAVCYGVAVRFIDGTDGLERNVYFYTTLGLLLVVTGLLLTLPEPWPAAFMAGLAVFAAASWTRVGRLFMLLHCIAYVIAAGVVSGLLVYSADVLAMNLDGPWVVPEGASLVLLTAAGVAAWIVTVRHGEDRTLPLRGLTFAVFVLFVTLAGGVIVGFIAPAAGVGADKSVDPGVLATVRTVVLSLATLLIAWLARKPRLRDWGWLVYPLLVGIGLKMVMQDFKFSRPSTMFIAMALYGTALIVAPRLRRGGKPATKPSQAGQANVTDAGSVGQDPLPDAQASPQ